MIIVLFLSATNGWRTVEGVAALRIVGEEINVISRECTVLMMTTLNIGICTY